MLSVWLVHAAGCADALARRRGLRRIDPSASTRCRARCCRSPPDRKEATIKHEEIKGFMAAMTMPYKVQGREGVRRPRAGRSDQRHAGRRQQRRLPEGRQESRRGAARAGAGRAARAAGVVRLRAAEARRAGAGRALRRSGRQDARRSRRSRARRCSITFIYTRCPLPTFCPLMDRHFAAIQAKLKERSRAEGRPPGERQLRPGDRHAGRC